MDIPFPPSPHLRGNFRHFGGGRAPSGILNGVYGPRYPSSVYNGFKHDFRTPPQLPGFSGYISFDQVERNFNNRPGVNNLNTYRGAAPLNGPELVLRSCLDNIKPNRNLRKDGKVTSPSATKNKNNIDKKQKMENHPVVQEDVPQYRIFKRGDSIPGLMCPLDSFTSNGLDTSQVSLTSNNSKSTASLVDENSSEVKNNNNAGCGSVVVGPKRTPTGMVTELSRFHGLDVEYRLTSQEGPPHAPIFTIVLHLGPAEQYEATGSSIKRAQTAAATKALESTQLKKPPSRGQPRNSSRPASVSSSSAQGKKRPNLSITQLNALAEQLGQKVVFTTEPPRIVGTRSMSAVSVTVAGQVCRSEGKNVHIAKNLAAQQALGVLVNLKQEVELMKMLQSTNISENSTDDLADGTKNPISIVFEMAMKRDLKVSFEVTGEEGPPHQKVYAVKCVVGEIETFGDGSTKQAAKKSSCEQMINKLKTIPLAQPKNPLKLLTDGLKPKAKLIRKKPVVPVIKEVDKQVVSPISRLLHISHIRKYKEPEFVVKQADPSSLNELPSLDDSKLNKPKKKKKPFFTIQVIVGPFVCEGSGPNKKIAKQNAADNALIAMGYPPSKLSSSNDSKPESKVVSDPEDPPAKRKSERSLKITGGRQIVPGLLVIKQEPPDDHPNPLTEESNSAPSAEPVQQPSNPTTTTTANDAVQKLEYLAQLLGIAISYTNFPNKEGFLSVAILGSNPPRMAHGTGVYVEEAQNNAASQILIELATTGLEGLKTD